MDLSALGASLLDICGASAVGAWYVLDGAETGWDPKPQRRWMLLSVPEAGPTVQMVPRTTQDWDDPQDVKHSAHVHKSDDSPSCRINKDGWICAGQRKPIRRRLLDKREAFSCMEPDEDILEAVGCRR